MNITVLGSINMDMVIQTPRMPETGETIKGDSFHVIPGGKGANQAVALARQNIQTTMIGCVGGDDFGKRQLKILRAEGIDCSYINVIKDKPTGVASILVDKQSRNSIVIVPGANEFIALSQVEKASQAIKKADMLICQLEVNFNAVENAIELACSQGTKTLLNPAPARELSDTLLQKIDYLIPNEIEVFALTGVQVEDFDSAGKAGEILLEKGVKNLLITMGKKGVAVITPDICFLVPALSVNAVDTTAAGDTFIGYFAASIVQTNDIRHAVQFAQTAAALTVTKLGAQSSIPTLTETNNLFEKTRE
ncbi:MAG: ribokinase [Desulfobacterales bacterium]|nr:ribokinase [Desulfobacterales bacterium]